MFESPGQTHTYKRTHTYTNVEKVIVSALIVTVIKRGGGNYFNLGIV